MNKGSKIILNTFISIAVIGAILLLIYQYTNLSNQYKEVKNTNSVLTENNEVLTEEVNTLQKELDEMDIQKSDSTESDINVEEIKTQREELHQDIDETIKQFLEARYVINDQTKHKRYESAVEVSTENALDRYFEKAIQSVTSDTKLREYSELEDYKSYIALEDVNTSRTSALAKGKQVLKTDDDSAENITNFLFEVDLVMENNKWKVDEITVKDISLYDN